MGHERGNLLSGVLEIITERIARLNTKASEIDGLRLETQFLKSRLKHLEDGGKRPFRADPQLLGTKASNLTADWSRQNSVSLDLPILTSQSDERKALSVEALLNQEQSLPGTQFPNLGTWNAVQNSDRSTSPQTLVSLTSMPHDTIPGTPLPQPPSKGFSNAPQLIFWDPNELQEDSGDIVITQPRNIDEPSISDHPKHMPESAPAPSQQKPHRWAKSSRRRRRGEGPRDVNGVRIRKNGMLDGRAGNYKYLKA